MLAIKIWNYLKGYVIIKVEGLTLERLLNLASTHNIYLWDIKRHNNIVLEMKATTKGFKELKNIVKKVGCRIEIKEKIGFPFIIMRLRQRKMLVLGFLLFCTTILLLTSTVWKIEIIGNEQTPKEEIISLLKDNNIAIGKIKYKIEKEEAKDILINKYDYFSFVSVNIKGTVLTIEVKEQDLPPEKVDKSFPCNIIAKKKGVIVKAVAKKGRSIVEKGDVVEEGQQLITGILTNENTEDYILVHSEGEVLALTRYSHTLDEPIIKKEERDTGKVYKQKGLKINNKGIAFIKGDIPFVNYKEVITEKPIINLERYGLDFPIKTITNEYREVEFKEIKQNIDFLKKSLQVNAIKEINKSLPKKAEIQSKNVMHQINGNILTTIVTVEVIEDISRKQIIE